MQYLRTSLLFKYLYRRRQPRPRAPAPFLQQHSTLVSYQPSSASPSSLPPPHSLCSWAPHEGATTYHLQPVQDRLCFKRVVVFEMGCAWPTRCLVGWLKRVVWPGGARPSGCTRAGGKRVRQRRPSLALPSPRREALLCLRLVLSSNLEGCAVIMAKTGQDRTGKDMTGQDKTEQDG